MSVARRPRLGFVGLGWIGENRMRAVIEHGIADVVAVADPSPERRAAALAAAPGAMACEHLGQLLELPLDGIVIATPSAMHAEQCEAALARGLAVFCQKPLGRNAQETSGVVEAARRADRLLGVDFSYRYTSAVQRMRDVITSGGIGRVYAVDLTFHNAYGPDAAWFYDRAQSGGGCVVDLGVHLVDLALWMLDFPTVEHVESRLFTRGMPMRGEGCEDFAAVQMALDGNIVVRLACSWRVSAGRDAVIEASFFGSEGGVAMKNVDGSFYDFTGELYRGTRREPLSSPPDAWGGRAIVAWVDQLAKSPAFDPSCERLVDVARTLDRIYQAGAAS